MARFDGRVFPLWLCEEAVHGEADRALESRPLLSLEYERDQGLNQSFSPRRRSAPGRLGWFMRLLAHRLQSPTATLKTSSSLARAQELLGVRETDGRILNLGSGNTDYGKNVINLDVVILPNVTVVADAVQLPFQGESMDAVFAQAVLEHVRRPYGAVQEIYRVLKPGGIVYVDVPFLQVYHDRVDFQRYTADGLRELFRDFEVVDVEFPLGRLLPLFR